MRKGMGVSTLKELTRLRDCRTRRVSSWDKSGKNRDCIQIPKGERVDLAVIQGAGCITHIWFTVGCNDPHYLRRTLLRAYWDGEASPSIDCPLGDFFGLGHCIIRPYSSLPLNITGGDFGGGTGMNCYFQMPFSNGARIEIVNECESDIGAFYYYIDYESYDSLDDDVARFHAQWRRSNPTQGRKIRLWDDVLKEVNLTGEGNYVILEAEGRGHYVGCNLSVDNLELGADAPGIAFGGTWAPFEWWGEGDDMIFIDGEEWPPSLHGTGTEDYFTHAWGMQNVAYPYAGVTIAERDEKHPKRRKTTCYRFHIEDPVVFHKSIKVTIEHGHANHQSNDYASVAYWYQTEPHKPFEPMLPVDERLPRPDPE